MNRSLVDYHNITCRAQPQQTCTGGDLLHTEHQTNHQMANCPKLHPLDVFIMSSYLGPERPKNFTQF